MKILLVCTCSLLFVPALSWAQSGDPIAARTLFEDGIAAAEAGDYAAACPKFTRSYQLDPAVGTLLNIADCEEHLGHPATAWARYRQALDKLPKTDSRYEAFEKAAADLAKRICYVTIRLAPNNAPNVSVRRDGNDIPTEILGTPLAVDPGHHVFSVSAEGHEEGRCEIDSKEGETQELLCSLGKPLPVAAAISPSVQPQPQPQPPLLSSPTPREQQPTAPSHTAAYVVGGIGAAGIVAGIVTRLAAFQQQSTLDAHCPNHACDSTGMDALSRARTLQTVSTVALIAGAVGVGTGVYLGLSSTSPATSQTGFEPFVLTTGAGLSLRRRF
jgi:hypothetical protein